MNKLTRTEAGALGEEKDGPEVNEGQEETEEKTGEMKQEKEGEGKEGQEKQLEEIKLLFLK